MGSPSIPVGVGLRTVDVVVGVILVNGKFLAEKRRADENIDPDITCLPGGHVEPKETKVNALKREMKEELSIDVSKPKFIRRERWVASNGEKQNVHYYLVSGFRGEPVCRTAEALLWTDNVDNLDVEMDRRAVEKGKAMLESAGKATGRVSC